MRKDEVLEVLNRVKDTLKNVFEPVPEQFQDLIESSLDKVREEFMATLEVAPEHVDDFSERLNCQKVGTYRHLGCGKCAHNPRMLVAQCPECLHLAYTLYELTIENDKLYARMQEPGFNATVKKALGFRAEHGDFRAEHGDISLSEKVHMYSESEISTKEGKNGEKKEEG